MRARILLMAASVGLFLLPGLAPAQGIYLPGGGAAHLSMGGASTATPVDAIGAQYWNPAAISRLGRSEVSIGGAFLYPNFYFESTAPGPFGLRSGRTRSDSGLAPTSNVGIVYQPEEGPLTYGFALNTLGGGGVNFPGDLSNPILSGIGPLGNVQGPIAGSMTLLQLSPSVSYKVSDRLAIGAGPTAAVAITSFDPAFFGAPDDANGDGIGTFPTGSHSRPFWGGGFRAGLVYSATDRLDVGFGYTSPQWFETWTYNARNEIGLPRTLTLNTTLPAIYSLGMGYRATDRLQLVADVRYLDYANAELFGPLIRDGGLGWQSVFGVAVGGRYQVTDCAALSLGYAFNENPIPSVGTLFNVQGPVITQNLLAAGASVQLTDAITTTLGYAYGFENSITGPVREATGVGTRLEANVHMVTFTLQFQFGGCGPRCNATTSTSCDYPSVVSPMAGPATLGSAEPVRVSGS